MRKNEYPEEGEFVIGTVESIFNQGAFIALDEYSGKKGMLHLSEISPKWVRNIRDYVKENQKVVLLVLRVDTKRKHIDLSLRRVSDFQRKRKLQEVKQNQRVEKLLSLLSEELKISKKEVDDRIAKKITDEFGDVYAGLESISNDPSLVDRLGLKKEWRSKLLELIKKSIKPTFVEITGYVEFSSYDSKGINIIKESLRRVDEYKTDCELDISYVSAPLYRIRVKAPDYKKAEATLRGSVDRGIEYIKKHSGVGEFHRELPK